jgi:tetratricopeptide (TPR) repeat protein
MKLVLILVGFILCGCEGRESESSFTFSLSDSEAIWIDEYDEEEIEPDLKLLALDSVILSNPNDPLAYIKRAYYREDNWSHLYGHDEILNDYDKAIELDSKDVGLKFDKAIYLSKSGHKDLAIDEYLKIITMSERKSDALNNLAGIIMDLSGGGQYSIDLLKNKLDVVVKNKPDEDNPKLLKNEILDVAILYYNKALSANPKNGMALGNSALCMYYQGKFEQACKAWKKALKLGDETAYGYITDLCE